MSAKRPIPPNSMGEEGSTTMVTPEAKRFEMEANAQEKERLLERLAYFYDEMQQELGHLIQIEQEAVRTRYLAMFDNLVSQTEIQTVMDRGANRQRMEEFEFRVKEWEDTERAIKQDLVRLQKMLMGDFDEEEEQAAALQEEEEEDKET